MKKRLLIVAVSLILTGCTQKETAPKTEGLATPTIMPTPTVVTSTTPTKAAVASVSASPSGITNINKEKEMQTATIKTAKGDIVIKLDLKSAPKTVANFVSKAKSDFYKNLTFHRVEDWVIQGGDPLGTGTGGGKMATELSNVPFKEGSVGVARGGDIKVSNDSQFFICTADCAWLTGQYTIFGEVTSGMEVAKQIAVGDKILSITVE